MEELISLENVLLAVAWAAVGGIAIVALVWFVRALKPQDGPRIVSKHWSFPVPETPITLLSPERRYELWRKELRAWTDEDGTQVGLDALLERWRGVPHEKPKPRLVAGMDVGDPKGAVTVVQFVDTANGVATHHRMEFPDIVGSKLLAEKIAALAKLHLPPTLPPGAKFNYVAPTIDDLDRMRAGGEGAFGRFFERNRKQMASLTPNMLSALEAKAAEFREPFAGERNAGKKFTEEEQRVFLNGGWTKPGEHVPGFKVGDWVRGRRTSALYAGDLMRVEELADKYGWFLFLCPSGVKITAKAHEIEPARPIRGEWWRIVRACMPNFVGKSENLDPFKADHDWGYCECILEPINFGRGEGAKS